MVVVDKAGTNHKISLVFEILREALTVI